MLNKNIYFGNKKVIKIYKGISDKEHPINGETQYIYDTESSNCIINGDYGISSANTIQGYESTSRVIYSKDDNFFIQYELPVINNNYDVYAWIPYYSGNNADFFITATNDEHEWKRIFDATNTDDTNKWVKVFTIPLYSKTTIKLFSLWGEQIRVNAIKLVKTDNDVSEYSLEIAKQDNINTNIYINQVGYDIGKSKRATIPNVENGTAFSIENSNNVVVYNGVVQDEIADFTDFEVEGTYTLCCDSKESYEFKIGYDVIKNAYLSPSLKFMEMSRADNGINTNTTTGYAWRDSHQFSFELDSLAMLYMSNPSYFKSLPYDVYRVDECEYEELRTQNEPNIIWLMKFGVIRYYKWCTEESIKLHALIKCQLAYFLYLYPHISDYVTEEFYTTIRDFTIQQWSESSCDKSWYEVNGGINHNLFSTQSKIGNLKGMLPPGYAIIPNLMMYEVLKRDRIDGYQNYLDSSLNNLNWVINNVDLDNPKYTKGQRMSERITLISLCYFKKLYPDLAPTDLDNTINDFVDTFIARSNNLWDFRKMSSFDDGTKYNYDLWCPTTYNECGNVAGVPSIAYVCCMVITDESKKERLKKIATAHFDSTLGRNPLNKCYNYNAVNEIIGADANWGKRMNGVGDLKDCIGCLDGSPKKTAYPYNPSDSEGYSEGWVAFNTALNTSLAFLCNENEEITDGIGIFKK